MDKEIIVGNSAHGRTAKMRRELDKWLMEHPYKKAEIRDTKTGKAEYRWFEPHKQLESPKHG